MPMSGVTASVPCDRLHRASLLQGRPVLFSFFNGKKSVERWRVGKFYPAHMKSQHRGALWLTGAK